MKKVIFVFSIIALAFAVIITCLSLCAGFSNLALYQEVGIETSENVNQAIASRCTAIITSTAVDVLFCLYLMIFSGKIKTFVPEIIISAVRFAVLPIVSLIYSSVQVTVFAKTISSAEDTAMYSVFNSGVNAVSGLNLSGILIAFTFAFAIAQKALTKKTEA